MAQYISVKRKQQTNKHAPLAIMLCLLFLLSSFSFSFADNYLSFADLVLVENSNPSKVSYADDVISVNNGSGILYFAIGGYGITSGSSITLSGNFTISNNNSNYSSIGVRFYSEIGGNPIGNTWSSGSISQNVTSVPIDFTYTFDDNTNYIAISVNTHIYDIDISGVTLEGISDGGGGGITNNGNAIIVVNPGNVAYIGYDSATFNFLINLDKPVSNINSNARYGFATELPSGSITLTPSTGNPLPLRKSIPDILGRSATWVGSVDTETIGYIIVYNPVYDNNGNANKPIRVTVTEGYMNVTQFPLTATDIGGEIVSTGSTDDFYISDGMQGSTDLPSYIYSQSSDGVVVTSSALTVPTTPYNYVDNSTGSAESGLQGFIQKILDLLSAPIQHIQNLYNSAIAFFGLLTSFWDWLPTEVSSVIASALVVLVVIGVVKFLWK